MRTSIGRPRSLSPTAPQRSPTTLHPFPRQTAKHSPLSSYRVSLSAAARAILPAVPPAAVIVPSVLQAGLSPALAASASPAGLSGTSDSIFWRPSRYHPHCSHDCRRVSIVRIRAVSPLRMPLCNASYFRPGNQSRYLVTARLYSRLAVIELITARQNVFARSIHEPRARTAASHRPTPPQPYPKY